MNREDIQKEIMRFIQKEFKVNPDNHGLDLNCDIFEEGYVDSLGINKLIAFLEKRFEVEINEDYFLDDRFVSIQGQTDIILDLKADE